MSFFGGNTSLSATSTPAKQGGLFAPSFSTPATTGTAPAFGAPTFGIVQSQTTPSFGTPSFGVATTQAAPAFGTPSFGATTSQTAPNFGQAPAFGSTAGFGGATATSAPTLGGFGSFGTTNTASTSFGGFGTNTVTSAAPSLFGGTGPTATSTAPAFGGFGITATSNAPGGGYGGFGTSSTTTSAPLFGGFGTQTSGGFGGFGAGGSSFGSNFGKPATSTVTPGFGGFGGTTNFMLGQPQQQAPQISPDEAFAQSIFNVSIYGDERDTILAKWNYLQALWGIGKSFYSQNAAPVDITPQNYLCRFKAIGYSRLPGKDNKLGLVALNFNKPLTEIKNQQNQIITILNALFGNKPNIVVNIEASKEPEEKKSQLIIYVEEKSQITPSETKRVLATDVANYLNQVNFKAQLTNLGVTEILALVHPDEDQLKEYLENPPKGIDPRMWCQANLDNPDKSKFIAVPLIGFNDLKWRLKCQENEVETHALYLKKVEGDLSELRQRHAAATAKILEHKRKLAELTHKILRIIVKQESTRKMGTALTSEEEALRTKLENMQAILSAPTQFKGRLSELLSQMRMQGNLYAQSGVSEYTIDKDCEDEMKMFLAMQQKAMEAMAETVNKDLKALQIIYEGLPDLIRS